MKARSHRPDSASASTSQSAEIALQSERQMQRMMDTIPSLLWSSAPDGELTYISARARSAIAPQRRVGMAFSWR
jgi:hypothetical protein